MAELVPAESVYQASGIAELIFEFGPDAILLVDKAGLIVRANARCENIFAYSPDELIGQKLEMLLPERFQKHHEGHREKYFDEPHARAMGAGFDLYARRKDGSEFAVDIMLAPIKTPAGPSVMAVVRDITERKIQERLVRQLMQQREDYVATLTHDLKTPILAANRMIQLFIDGDFGPVSGEQQDILKTILDSNDSMYRLVRTLLDVYKYDSGMKKLSLASHDLCLVIEDFLTKLKPLAGSKQIRLTAKLPDRPTFVTCDIDEIRRVIDNLVDNAIKFTPAGGRIEVRLERKADRVTIVVADTGRGIPEDEKSQLFQRFWQAPESGRNYASTGLGLYLCRKIIELHAGDIWCDSDVGAGSTFNFTLAIANQ